MAGPVLADEARPVHADQDRLVVLGRVVDDLVEGTLEEGRVDRDDWPAAAQGDPGRQGDRVLLRDADVHEPVRELRLEPVEAGPGGHSRRDRHDVAILPGRGDDLLGEVVRVVGLLGHAGLLRRGRHRPAVAGARPGRDRRDLAGSERAGRTAPASLMGVGHRRQRGAVEADLVPLRRTVAAPLLGPDVHEDRDVHGEGATEGVLERPQVVAGNHADVGDPEILEELAGLGEADHRLAHAAAELQGRRTDHRDPLHQLVVAALRLLPGGGELDVGQVLRERPHRGADGHLVVVQDDEDRRAPVAEVVQRLQREAAHEGRVADDHRDPLHAVPDVTRGGEACRDRETRPGVAAVEHVVLRLAAPREAADPSKLAERPEPRIPAGEELVRVGLVAGVPHDPVPGRLEDAVKRQRDLHHAERRSEVTARHRDGGDDRPPDLLGQLQELRVAEAAKVCRALQAGEDRHVLAP